MMRTGVVRSIVPAPPPFPGPPFLARWYRRGRHTDAPGQIVIRAAYPRPLPKSPAGEHVDVAARKIRSRITRQGPVHRTRVDGDEVIRLDAVTAGAAARPGIVRII